MMVPVAAARAPFERHSRANVHSCTRLSEADPALALKRAPGHAQSGDEENYDDDMFEDPVKDLGGAESKATDEPVAEPFGEPASDFIGGPPRTPAGEPTSADTSLPAPGPAVDSKSSASKAGPGAPPPRSVPKAAPSKSASQLVPAGVRKYRVSIDLRSVRGISDSCWVSLRYTYPFFGPDAPAVETSPPAQAAAGQDDVPIPNGFCAFEFEASERELRRAFESQPLLIQVFQRLGDATAEPRELGIIRGNLQGLLSAPVLPTGADGGQSTGAIRAVDNYCSIRRVRDRVGTVRVVLTLEDLGPVAAAGISGPASAASEPSEIPQQVGYQLAWELEMWRRAEQSKFEAEWRKREEERMAELEEEFGKQLQARERRFEARQKDVQKLEKKLKNALFDCERQENALKVGESAVEEYKKKLHREYEQQKHETLLTLKRLRDQHKHEMSILKLHNTELKQQAKVLKKRVETANAAKREVELEFQRYRQKTDKSLMGQLRQQIADKDLELRELRFECKVALASERRAKGHLRKCLEEIVRLRRLRDEDHKEKLRLEELEVERRKERYAKREAERQQRDIRNELVSIQRELHSAMQTSDVMPLASAGRAGPAPGVGGSKGLDEIQRLEDERRDLVASGVYLGDHPIVLRLTERIKALKEARAAGRLT